MKDKKQKYEEAVERNLGNAEMWVRNHPDLKNKLFTRERLGVKKDDNRFDTRIAILNASGKMSRSKV